jgi:actin-related protein
MLIYLGTTMMSGFKERMTEELSEKQIDVDMKFPQNRNYINFVGGSKFASSPHMQQLWVTKKDFDEAGVSIIYRKWS